MMSIAEICMRRPILACVLSISIMLLGILGYSQLDVMYKPVVFKPSVSISVSMSGASPNFVLNSITTPLENNLQGVEHVEHMSSHSAQGYSSINLEFEKGITRDQFSQSLSEIQSNISSVQLPNSASTPQISLNESGSNKELYIIAISAPKNVNYAEFVAQIRNNIFKPLIEQIPGSGQNNMYPGSPNVLIKLNPIKMHNFNISNDLVNQRITTATENVNLGSLFNESTLIQLSFKKHAIDNLDKIKNLVISTKNNQNIYLKDIAQISVGYNIFDRSHVLVKGNKAVFMFLKPSLSTNPVEWGERVEKAIGKAKQQLPIGSELVIINDKVKGLKKSIHEVYETIIVTIIAVGCITILFIGNLKLSLVPTVTIPICLFGTCLILYMLGYSLNSYSLLAFVLAIGLVVDDAIIVLENAQRFQSPNKSILETTLESIKQINFSIWGMTIIVAAIFVPLFFLPQSTITVYKQQFAATLSFSVLISGFVAITLSPAMSAILLKNNKQSKLEDKLDHIFHVLSRYYKYILTWNLQNKWLPISLFIVLMASSPYLLNKLPSASEPAEYDGYLGGVVSSPSATRPSKLMELARPLVDFMNNNTFIENQGTFLVPALTGHNNMLIFGKIKDKYINPQSNFLKIVHQISNEVFMNKPLGLTSAIVREHNLNQGPGANENNSYDFNLSGNSVTHLVEQAKGLVEKLKKSSNILDAKIAARFDHQQYQVQINYQNAERLKVDLKDIVSALRTSVGIYKLRNQYFFNGNAYDIMISPDNENFNDLRKLESIYVKNQDNHDVRLSQLLDIHKSNQLSAIYKESGLQFIPIEVTPKSGVTMSTLIKEVNLISDSTLPKGFSFQPNYVLQKQQNENNQAIYVALACILFVYLILAALFNCFKDPFIILLTVPWSVISALWGMELIMKTQYFQPTLDMFSIIGILTLSGLISKHGILITKYANQLIDDCESSYEAVIKAATLRLRPILMTTTTMILGAVPLLFSTGVVENSHWEIACILIIGLTLGTLGSLFIVPVAYCLLKKK